MRDPKRIEGFMRRLTDVWKCVPDWRFGQLVENILRDNGEIISRIFFIEDDRFDKMIAKFTEGLAVESNPKEPITPEMLESMFKDGIV